MKTELIFPEDVFEFSGELRKLALGKRPMQKPTHKDCQRLLSRVRRVAGRDPESETRENRGRHEPMPSDCAKSRRPVRSCAIGS
jgi:hypothetical protein